jgi:hypothetical protein
MKWFKGLLVLSLLFALGSCAKDDAPSGDLNGTYTGIYEQTTSSNNDSAGTVKIVFVGSNFSGESQASVKPICNGTYEIVGDSINFKNLCSIADADLLLVGKYQIKETADSLYLVRPNELFSLGQQ